MVNLLHSKTADLPAVASAKEGKDGRDFKTVLNPHRVRRSLGVDGSLDSSAVVSVEAHRAKSEALAKEEVVTAKCEPSVKDAKPELRYQFERLCYVALDADSQPGKPVFNRTITLKDTWAKEAKEQG
ncbi:MAG: Glutamine--tRNA ligase [Verrucomicrobiae bacterium]|nr:Glutamine--tRNA ligase [Verrucomicrobiae bacterium]